MIRAKHAVLRLQRQLGLVLLGVAGAAAVLWAAPAAAQVKGLPDFTDLVEQVSPSVVNIRTTEKVKLASGGVQMDPGIEEFFKRFGIPVPNGRLPRGQGEDAPERRGVGSGFILSADGVIMTNAHVVDGADELMVTLTDKREFKAKDIGADKRTDVAIVKIDATGLPAVKTGDVAKLRVGEWVMAIGSPFNLENTVTAGIVSAKQRDTGDFLPFLQTDVAINPGNSGGPLINMRGEVVGINSQIYSPSGGYAGISFAIPIDEALRVSDQLRSNGRVIRGRIGVRIDAVSKEVAESIGLGKPTGALVRGVEAAGPAEKAGLEAGDIITRVDGKVVDKPGDLQRNVGAIKPGSKATLQIFRRGAYKDVVVMVAELEADKTSGDAAADSPASAPTKSSWGLSVSNLSAAQRSELRIKGGVKVDTADGQALRAGLKAGDIIMAINNQDVMDVKQFTAIAARLEKSKRVTMLVRRGDWVDYVVLTASP
jgi:serine protease Do